MGENAKYPFAMQLSELWGGGKGSLWVDDTHWLSHPVARVWEETILSKAPRQTESKIFIDFFLLPLRQSPATIKTNELSKEILPDTLLLQHLITQHLLKDAYLSHLGADKLSDWECFLATLPTRNFSCKANIFHLFPPPQSNQHPIL